MAAPQEETKRFYKIPIIGDVEVGKTSLLVRYVENRFSEEATVTIDSENKVKELIADGEKVSLQIW
jgi:GTPase SAR1 family protein